MTDADPLSPELLAQWLEQSNDLLALTDRSGNIRWSNPGFMATTGCGAAKPVNLLAMAPSASSAERVLRSALDAGTLATEELELQTQGGGTVFLSARASPLGAMVLWTFQDVTTVRRLATRAQRQSELLDMAQEFGRIGVWEREIPSGEGRWDRHVFNFWGMDPREGAPSYQEAIQRIHPDDRSLMSYAETTLAPGRYAQRYRVLRPDGTTRWIHSQWEVKNSSQGLPDRAIGIMVDDTIVYNSARALGEANAQLELAVELGRIAIWRQDLKTERIHYNERGFELLGLRPRADGVPVSEAHDHIHPDDLPMVLASARRALVSDEPTDTEARYQGSDGSWRYVLTRSVVQRDSAGAPLAVIGVALDVTDRVEHLRTSEELARRLDAAARAARVGIWTTSASVDDTAWNRQMFELFDWPTDTPPASLAEWIENCVHPSERARIDGLARSYLSYADGPFEIEFRTIRRDGSSRWIVLRADIERAHDDRRRLIGVALDVTEHHQTLAALRQASERATLITRQAGIGTWEFDFLEGLERWDEQMFHLRGLPVAAVAPNREQRVALVHPEDLAVLIDSREAADSHLPAAYEFRVRLPDGSYRWIASRSVVVRDERGVAVRRVGVNWDATESKNAELVRQQAALTEREMQAKSQFLSRMSHELRTPLNAVLGFTQLLQIEASQASASAQVSKLGHIRAAGEHLLALINDVLDLSSLESGELKLQLQPVDLRTLVAQSLPLVESLAVQQGVAIGAHDVTGVALADATRMRQVLTNLFSNAIKYNRRGGKVLVESRTEAARVILVVRDTGRGLTRDQVAHLFEPFNRLGIESEGIEGTGIGLTIVKALVEGMGGTVRVSSRRGEGTVFEVALPVYVQGGADDHARHPPVAEPATQTERLEGSGRILYIEDNPINVMLVEELVKSLSQLQIVSEANGATGVARARAWRPDVILIDLQLPDFDGFEVLRRLRAHPETAATPCIALSANAMPEDIARGLAAGFADYWTKPIDFKIFIASLRKLFPVEAATLEGPG